MKTKRAKTVTVHYKEVKDSVSVYTCPSCKTVFVGGVAKAVTRFKCGCGQELIVERK